MPATVITITSGKGGVGKTTTTAAFGAALALRGHRVCAVDFDVGLRNLDLVLGLEKRVVYDFLHVAEGKAKLGQALIKHKQIDNLYVLATSQTAEKNALTNEGVGRVMEQLRAEFDYVICDSPAGIEHGAMAALYHADHAIVVCNPEVSSIRDADRILGFVGSKSKRSEDGRDPVREHLLVTRYDEDRVKCGEMLPVNEIKEILSAELIGIVPESRSVLRSSNSGVPASIDPQTDAGAAYRDAVAHFLGETKDPIRLPGQAVGNHPQRGFLMRLFRRG
ncbi:septum site-determining protein MinD [Paracraurococcus ruber]|uniref:Septum site-determining protein MinD n=1 Tax=Paracraurococcus ruber TaxID=77675 RepID=A0ABS1CRS1_9PROT|nr:septum site-determining protein MinD [Paracraurococcus ruber]MBK1656687.1 septum site-determining protein MinD [Paracraurococcus ruber]TDG33695.1 septum site-determining protein MinD [Paracraurococcus ruber]